MTRRAGGPEMIHDALMLHPAKTSGIELCNVIVRSPLP
jgi:hypothetical protein